MTPLEAIRIWGLEKLGRYYSHYRAIVLNSQPDDLNTGNILVQIPRVQGGMKIVARAKTFAGGPGFGRKYFTPQPGEIVWVEFEMVIQPNPYGVIILGGKGNVQKNCRASIPVV